MDGHVEGMDEPRELLLWFDRHQRHLPWRKDREPYRVWVSEIMLQQTRVGTVLPFYHRFLGRFPSVEALAAAALDEVLVAWSGLGYYRRARQLHAAARQVVADGGKFPDTVEGLLRLSGVGPYTAAAIASISFGIAVPVLDGNVERVLARRLGEEGDVKKATVRRSLLEAASRLLDPSRAGDSNQAMMELGATICLPKRPLCLLCPLAEGCKAHARGEESSFPRSGTSTGRTEEVALVAVVVEDPLGRTLLFRRPDHSSLLAGLWEVPWSEVGNTREEAEKELKKRYGGSWRLGERLADVQHSITYRDISVKVHRGEVSGGGEIQEGAEAGWFTESEICGLAASSLLGKILATRGERLKKAVMKKAKGI